METNKLYHVRYSITLWTSVPVLAPDAETAYELGADIFWQRFENLNELAQGAEWDYQGTEEEHPDLYEFYEPEAIFQSAA